jgi:hypothetical protein
VPSRRAASRIALASIPQIAAARSGVYGSTVCCSASNPVVCASTYERSIHPFSISSRWSAFMSARLVPLRTARWTSASRATGVSRGSTHSSAGGSEPRRRSSIRIHNTACVSATLWPNSASASQWSTSVYEAGCPSLPNDALSAAAAVAVHSRVLPSMCGVPMPAFPITASV